MISKEEPKSVRVRPESTLEAGYWVVLVVKPGTAMRRVWTGQVQALDDFGMRITLVDWLTGMADGFDFFTPWTNVDSMQVATPDHSLHEFGQVAIRWEHFLREYATEEEREAGAKEMQETISALYRRGME